MDILRETELEENSRQEHLEHLSDSHNSRREGVIYTPNFGYTYIFRCLYISVNICTKIFAGLILSLEPSLLP